MSLVQRSFLPILVCLACAAGRPATAAPTATLDAAGRTAVIGNGRVQLVIDWCHGLRLAHLRDLAADVDWIPQPPQEPWGPGPGGMRAALAWKQDDIWPDLAPPSREFLLAYSPTGDLDAAAEAAARATVLTGAADCALLPQESRAVVEGDVARLDLVFAVAGHPVAVGLHAEVRGEVNAVRRWTSVRNTGSEPWLLHRLTTASMLLRPGTDDLELSWIETCTHPSSGPRSPTRWRQATRHMERLGPATRRTLRSDAATLRPDGGSSGCMAWLALRDPGRDAGLFAGWEWTGLFDVEVGDFGPESGAGAFGLRMGFSDEGGYARRLAPGETFTTPRAFFGFFRGDAEEAGRATRQVAGSLFALPWPEGRPPMFVGYCTWSNWQDFGDSNLLHLRPERLDAEIARCRDLGVELFILDYDWFPLLGDFRSDPERFPEGVEAVARKVKAAGMKFGLWMGFGQAHADAPIVREHPEFFVTQGGQPFVGGWGMRSLCFASQPCREYALGEITRVVEKFGVDWLKQDFDIIPVSDSREHAPQATDTRIESVEGYYWIKDRLRERFPRLYLDNWTPPMGGADFGNLQRHHSMMLCDDYHPLAVRSTAHGMAHLLPPTRTHGYLRAFSRGDETSPYAWRSAGFGNGLFLISDILQWDDAALAAARREIALFKADRELFLDGEIHDCFPGRQPDRFGWDGRLVWSPGLRRGMAQVFRGHDPRNAVRVPLRGLPATGRYRVTFVDAGRTVEVDGRALVTEGVEVSLPAAFTAETLHIEPLPGPATTR